MASYQESWFNLGLGSVGSLLPSLPPLYWWWWAHASPSSSFSLLPLTSWTDNERVITPRYPPFPSFFFLRLTARASSLSLSLSFIFAKPSQPEEIITLVQFFSILFLFFFLAPYLWFFFVFGCEIFLFFQSEFWAFFFV